MQPDVSVLLPAYNEAPNLPEVLDEIVGTLDPTGLSFEIVVVDDGSTDDSVEVLEKYGAAVPELRWIHFRRNAGKSEALQSGFELVQRPQRRADGRRRPGRPERDPGAARRARRRSRPRRPAGARQRNDRFIKRSTSKLYNWVTAKMTGSPGKDFNSGLKAMRRDVVDEIDLYGEMHRYIPVLAVRERLPASARSTCRTAPGCTASRSSGGPGSGAASSTSSRSSSSRRTRRARSTSSAGSGLAFGAVGGGAAHVDVRRPAPRACTSAAAPR